MHRDLHPVTDRELGLVKEFEIGVLEPDLERVWQLHRLLYAYQQQSGIELGRKRPTIDGQYG